MFERSGLTLENYKKTMDSWVAKVKGVKELSSEKKPFVTLWKYQRYNLQSGYRAEFKKYLGGSYIYTWEDVNDPSIRGEGWGDGYLQFTFPDEGTYRLSLTPIGLNPLNAFYFNPNKNKYYTHPGTGFREKLRDYNKDTTDKLIDIEQWGDVQWSTMENAFRDSSLFTISATDSLDLSKVTNMSNMFSSSSFNQSIEHWDVSKVTDMSGMFSRAWSFNQPLEQWDVSNVTNMGAMFANTREFNQPLEQWDVSNVTNMGGIFQNTSAFNQPLEKWDVSSVTNMSGMFGDAKAFNQPLEKWNVSNVTTMSKMFQNASVFNQPLEKWNVSNVTDMSNMFEGTIKFNQPIEKWDLDNVTSMSGMFEKSTAFNQPLNNWDVRNKKHLSSMFTEAKAFNQPLGNWVFGHYESRLSTLNKSSLDCENYKLTLKGWAENPETPHRKTLYVQGLKYNKEAEVYRNILINEKDWEFYGDEKGECVN